MAAQQHREMLYLQTTMQFYFYYIKLLQYITIFGQVFEDFPKFFQRPNKHFVRFFKHFPKMAKDLERRSEDVSTLHQQN